MIIDITAGTIKQIRNPAFAAYASIYLQIYEDFLSQVAATGIEFEDDDDSQAVAKRRTHLIQKGLNFRNSGRSLLSGAISPACVACQKGIGSATFTISLRCHRDCFYCFNPNQQDYDLYTQTERNVLQELTWIRARGQRLEHIALTGGEPLLHTEEVVAFFQLASELFPDASKRLYTSGDHVDTALLRRLRAAGLDEIRFSIRMHDTEKGQRHTLERIALARDFIPRVMVEMPVLPGTLDRMKALLVTLDDLGIHSINLLEFCYPLTNAEAFNRHRFKVKQRPYEILYNYWYAGGVPVAGSELECLDLLEFAVDQGVTMGVHYCSLENKLTGQNYQQNHGQPAPDTATFSNNDYLYKTAKVFGADVPKAQRVLRRKGFRNVRRDRRHDLLEFPVTQIPALNRAVGEIGLSTGTLEKRQDGAYLRELKVDLTTPALFDLNQDV